MKAILSFNSRWKRNESGNAAIEFAFIGTILFSLTLGIFELGRLAYMSHKLVTAAGGTTRMVVMGATENAIESSIRSWFSQSEQSALTIKITSRNPDGTPYNVDGIPYTRIEARYALPLILPNLVFHRNSVDLHALQLVPTG